jgi:hypothetical protein
MTELPPDPFAPPPWTYADALQTGRMHFENLTRQGHYAAAVNTVNAMSDLDLRSLALDLAAKVVADDAREHDKGDWWLRWWRGIDGVDEHGEPADIESTPLQLLKLMQPREHDDGSGTMHNPPDS